MFVTYPRCATTLNTCDCGKASKSNCSEGHFSIYLNPVTVVNLTNFSYFEKRQYLFFLLLAVFVCLQNPISVTRLIVENIAIGFS